MSVIWTWEQLVGDKKPLPHTSAELGQTAHDNQSFLMRLNFKIDHETAFA